MNLYYDNVRDRLLRAANWGFAKKVFTGNLLKSAPGTPDNTDTPGPWTKAWPAPPWLYSYGYPSDCLRIRAVRAQPYYTDNETAIPIFPYGYGGQWPIPHNPDSSFAFEKAFDTDSNNRQITIINTNVVQALLVYTARVTEINAFDTNFADALESALASEAALQLTGSPQIMRAMAEKANAIILEARVNDANEGLTVIDNVPDWMQIRGVMSNTFGYYTEPYGPLFGGM